MAKLRKAKLTSLKSVFRESQRLLEVGYHAGGEWSLGQICDQLAKAFDAQRFASPLPGFMQAGLFTAAATVVSMTQNRSVPTLLDPDDDIADETGVARLEKAIKPFRKRIKRTKTSVIPGSRLAARQVKLFQLRHCEHHYSFRDASQREDGVQPVAQQNRQTGATANAVVNPSPIENLLG